VGGLHPIRHARHAFRGVHAPHHGLPLPPTDTSGACRGGSEAEGPRAADVRRPPRPSCRDPAPGAAAPIRPGRTVRRCRQASAPAGGMAAERAEGREGPPGAVGGRRGENGRFLPQARRGGGVRRNRLEAAGAGPRRRHAAASFSITSSDIS
jgi:hypothetical protein